MQQKKRDPGPWCRKSLCHGQSEGNIKIILVRVDRSYLAADITFIQLDDF